MKINTYDKSKTNYGISILKMILSFFVIMVHCYNFNKKYYTCLIVKKSAFHVPTFMFISFYFYSKYLFSNNIEKIKLRFQRILTPYIIYPFIFLFLNNFLIIIGKKGQYNRIISLNDLIYQLIFGRIYHDIFWFQFNLIFLTLMLTILYYLFKKNHLFIFIIFSFISYFFQYSGLNYNFFYIYKIHISISLGCVSEMMPITCSGLIFGKFKMLSKISKIKSKIILINFFFICFLINYKIFIIPKGFFYPGIHLNIQSILLFFLFAAIPINNKKIIYFMKFITSYTGGIYYLHIIIRNLLFKYIISIKTSTLFGCLVIYIICFIICLIGNRIFNKTKLIYLFY